MVFVSLQQPFLWGGRCCCLRSPGHSAHQPQLFTPSSSFWEPPRCLAPRDCASQPLSRCFQHRCPSRRLHEPTALQLRVSWPPFLDVSIPPVLTSESTIFFFSCQRLLIPVRSCCVCCCERFVWEMSSPMHHEISHPRALSGAWTPCR